MPDPLRHEALPYAGHPHFVSSCVSVLRDGLDRDERPILLAGQRKLDDVRDALGDHVEDVALVPTDEHGRNPSRILTLLDSFRAGGDERRALGVNETVSGGMNPAVLSEAQLAESLLNCAGVHDWSLSLICLYDTAALRPAALQEMRRSHPVIRGESQDNADYREDLADELYATELPPPPDAAEVATHDVVGPRLTETRAFVRAIAGGHGIAADRVDDLVLAANEIVTNSLRHADGRCTVTMWLDGASTFCQVEDGGYVSDPLIGRLAPTPNSASGRGLWLVNHLCDLVQVRSTPNHTVVRLAVDRPTAP